MYGRCRITPSGKVSLFCEYKGNFTVVDFIFVEQKLPSILGLKSFFELGLIKKIYSLEEEYLATQSCDHA